MANRGWVKIYRELMEHHLWLRKPFSYGQAWVDMIMMANHEGRKILIGKEIVDIPRGSFWTSFQKLADRWGWSRHKVYDFFTALNAEDMLEKTTKSSGQLSDNFPTNLRQKGNKQGTLVTLINYGLYQDNGTTEGQQKDNGRTTEGQRKDTNKKYKNDKNERNSLLPNGSMSFENDDVPYQEVLDFYNQHRRRMPESKTLSVRRKGFINARFDKYGLKKIKEVILLAEKSDFLNGGGNKGWIAGGIDWILRPENFPKVLEGKYDNKSSGKWGFLDLDE